eukprot:TRINITY_DN5406_c0_g2_i1.p2 TRINITY_DN5406_c0_g2~~TRINITY_DN5406_c0_g2_i1.p2  ORF type:complete len:382 (-),score=77.70 TRINITY_DN5406_c0_g2_i1:296-1441(-)
MGNLCPISGQQLRSDESTGSSSPGDDEASRSVTATTADVVEDPDPVEDHPKEDPAAPEIAFIDRSLIGPPMDAFADNQPDWQFEHEGSQWRSYKPEDSIEIDRYYQVYQQDQGARGTQAQVQVMKKDATVDFARMTIKVGHGRPRRVQRKEKAADWLNNQFFFDAFKDALSTAGVKVESSPEEMFSFAFNQDFRNMRDDGRKMTRGGQDYKLPIGWKRFAVNVKGQFDDGNNRWLREDDSGWAVAYHGTAKESLPGILSTGFQLGKGQKFEKETGAGIYCTPLVDVAQHYSLPRPWQGRYVQIVLQLRVKPETIRPVTTGTDFEKQYWVINEPEDMRPYGVLIRELPLNEYVSALEAVYGPAQRPADLPPLTKQVRAKWGW